MKLIEARKKANMSQQKVADALGVTDSAVCQWETGRTVPRLPTLRKLATLYKCTVDELLDDKDE